MNAAVRIRLVDSLETELDVANIASKSEAKVEKIGDLMRRLRADHEQNIANTRKGLKETLARLTADEKALKEEYEASRERLAARKALAREQARIDIEADEELIAGSKAFLAARK